MLSRLGISSCVTRFGAQGERRGGGRTHTGAGKALAMRCDVDWFCVISVLGSGARKPHAALYARAHCRIDSIGVVVHAPSLRRARARQVLRPLDEEQEELNRERAALLARLLMPSKPAAALSLMSLQAATSSPTLLQWRRCAVVSCRARRYTL